MHNNREAEMPVSTGWLAARFENPHIHVADTRKGDGCERVRNCGRSWSEWGKRGALPSERPKGDTR